MAETKTTATQWAKILWYGFVAGMISGMVKIGWEVIFPPRTPERNAINPPQTMAMQLGVPEDVVFWKVMYGGQEVYPFTLLLHFSFAIVFSILFVWAVQKWQKVAMWQGMMYGLVLWVAWHVLLMPIVQTVPAPWDQPFTEHFSEIFGHMVWGWSIAATAYFMIAKQKVSDLKNF